MTEVTTTTAGPAALATGAAVTIPDNGIIQSNNQGASAFDPPVSGTDGPFGKIKAAVDSPAPATDPKPPTGETATNVEEPMSKSAEKVALVDAKSGVDSTGTVTDVGVHDKDPAVNAPNAK